MSKPETMMIDDVKYIRADSAKTANDFGPTDIRIVILPRGWVIVGNYSRADDECTITDASIIRRWGTTNGLGEIAKNGPTTNTVLDSCYGDFVTPYVNVLGTIKCEHSKRKRRRIRIRIRKRRRKRINEPIYYWSLIILV